MITGVFHELTDPGFGVLVHEREATAAFGEALAGELHASLAHPLGGHLDVVRARLNAIGNLCRFQRLGDGRLVLGGDVGIQQAVARAASPQDDGYTGRNGGGDADEQQNGFQARLER